VLTSGGDAIYPRGLAVGVVERVVPDPEGTLVHVVVKPAANLSKLEEVLVITSTGEQMPSEMQQDVTEGQQKASDVLAEKLPSRADPNAPPDRQPDSASESADQGLTPPEKPPQPLLPDRYSPSHTPPATDLVPGKRTTNEQSSAVSGDESNGEQPPKAEAGGNDGTPAGPATKPPGSAAKPKPKAGTPGAQANPKKSQPPAKAPASKTTPTGASPATPPQGGA
jgi:rod shape-determining protein MreC